MTRKIMSDIVTSKKSIRSIPLSKKMKEKIEKETEINQEYHEKFNIPKSDKPANWNRKPLNPKFVIWLIAAICLVALFFGISIIFSSANIIITPRTETITFSNETYTAKLNSTVATDLPFEVLKINQEASETIEAAEEKEVSQKATGKIIIYNNYSATSQRLITLTRFESNNNKIYKINSSVIVPGYKKVDGKIIPGSIEATVTADQPGEEYNLKLADLTGDFKIPGFKGDPRYEGFYGRLKEDISGGLVGKQKIISDVARKVAESLVKTTLKAQLLKELYAVKPDNYLLFKDSYSIDYINKPDVSIDNKVKISLEGNLNAIVFDNLKFAKYFANKKINDFDGLQVEFSKDDDGLVTTFSGKDNTGLWKNNTLDIKFSGAATIKWLYDTEALKKGFAGKSESDLGNLLSQYKNSISGIKVLFKPVWTRYIPDNINKIKIIEEEI